MGPYERICAHFGPMGPLIHLTQTRIERFWAYGARRGPERDRKLDFKSFRTQARRKGEPFFRICLLWALQGLYGALRGPYRTLKGTYRGPKGLLRDP